MKNIREEKGLTYGIHASLHALKNDSYLAIGADVNKENVDLTINEISKELRRLRALPAAPRYKHGRGTTPPILVQSQQPEPGHFA